MYELHIALRHISARKRMTFFSVFAVALAIGVIVVFMSMMTGFTDELVESTIENSPHIVVSPQDNDEEFIHFYRYYSEQIVDNEGIIGVSPIFKGQAALQYKDNAKGVNLNGIDPLAEDAVMGIEDDIVSGSFFALSKTNNGVVIGDKLAEELEVKFGDSVDLVNSETEYFSYKVVGIFDSGTPNDETVAYARLDSVLDVFDENEVASKINIRVHDSYQADDIAASIEAETGLDSVSWMEANGEILELLNTQAVIVWIYYALIYIIAGFGIANTLFTVVMDKKSEIGMLMAMGTSRSSITNIFLIESVILGSMGVILGCIIGYFTTISLASYEISIPSETYFGLTTLPLKTDIGNYIYAIVFSLLINIVAGVYPARRASKLDPVEAIDTA